MRVVGRPAAPIDLALVSGASRMVRQAGELWMRPRDDPHHLARALALAGLVVEPGAAPTAAASLVPLIGRDLSPCEWLSRDVLTIGRIAVGEATRETLGSALVRRLRPVRARGRREACRRLLRGEDALLRWERRAWVERGAVRRSEVRRCFRPILLDAGAHTSSRPGGVLRASAGALTRWAFA